MQTETTPPPNPFPNRSPSIAKLADALAKAQAEITSASKDRENPHFRSRYATLASVQDACRGPLTKNGLAVMQLVSSEGPKVTVETLLTHSSGEWISSRLTLTAAQANPQAIGSAVTYARRYGLSAMVGVAPDDDDDGESATTGAPMNGARQQNQARHSAPPANGAAKVPTEAELLAEIQAMASTSAAAVVAKKLSDLKPQLPADVLGRLRTAYGARKAQLEAPAQ